MQPNAKTVEGRANIQKLFGMWMKGPMMHIMIKTVEVWGDENMLAAENSWSFLDSSGKTVDTGKSLEIYKKEEGVWKLHRDCYNSDMPPAPVK
jgi:ketosteroid isomerase-like protein